MNYKIYIYKNNDGKIIYVGQTKQSLKTRDYQHKHSKRYTTEFDDFLSENKHLMPEIIWEGESADECDYMEYQYIAKFDTFYNGFNSNRGSNPYLKILNRAYENSILCRASHTNYLIAANPKFDDVIAEIRYLRTELPSLYESWVKTLTLSSF